MATTFTNKLESFFDNNTPGGYIRTSINISDDDITERINRKFENQNYLTNNSMIPASQITGLAEVAISGRYNDLIGITGTNVSISNTLNEGTKIATITINGNSTDIYTPTNTSPIGSLVTEEDPIFLASPAAEITEELISNWNNKSNFNGDYNNLINQPDFAPVALSGDYNNLTNKPEFSSIALSGDFYDLINSPFFVIDLKSFTNNNLTEQENLQLQDLKPDSYILNCQNYIDSFGAQLDEYLFEQFRNHIATQPSILLIATINSMYKVEQINVNLDQENKASFFELTLNNINISNYEALKNDINVETLDSQISTIFNNLSFNVQSLILIFDADLNIIFIKKK